MSQQREQPEQHDAPLRRLPGAQRAAAFNEPAMEITAAELSAPGRQFGPPPAAPISLSNIASPPVALAPPGAACAEPSDSGGRWSQLADSPIVPGDETGSFASGWTPPVAQEKPAEWGRKRRIVGILSLGMAKTKPGSKEIQHRENIRAVRQGSWPRCARIVVANPKGGVGKTPLAVALGGKLAQIRGGGVIIWDAADAAGSTGARAEGRAGRCISEVQAHPENYSQPGTIAAAVATQSSFADVLGSLADREFSDISVQRVLWTLDRSYRISVADTGNVPHSPAFEAVLDRADLLVVPTTITKDSVDKALNLLRRLQDCPTGLLQRAVVAVMDTRGPQTPGLAAQIDGIFHDQGVGAVVHIPFEPVIAAGTSITVGDFSRESDIAWTALAAACSTNLITAPERN